jgi:hypothetical protein
VPTCSGTGWFESTWLVLRYGNRCSMPCWRQIWSARWKRVRAVQSARSLGRSAN